MVRARELGQNFLVDRNTVEVIERLARLSPGDVVLEVGGGLGVLSVRLAAHAGHVHVVEVDPRLEHRLREAVDGRRNVSVHVGDALELELRGFDPAPTKMVSNLPYGIAATIVLKTIEELPSVTEWLVMVQREVGERLAAAPGSPAYGAPSVLAQLACDVRILRPVSRTVFRPVPNVESVLLGLTRRSRTEDPGATAGSSVQALVHGAFAHRRKTLAGSLALVPGAPEGIRERARAALVRLGHPANQRAEQLAPDEFRRLEELLWS